MNYLKLQLFTSCGIDYMVIKLDFDFYMSYLV